MDADMKLALEISQREEQQRKMAAMDEEDMIRLAIEASIAMIDNDQEAL